MFTRLYRVGVIKLINKKIVLETLRFALGRWIKYFRKSIKELACLEILFSLGYTNVFTRSCRGLSAIMLGLWKQRVKALSQFRPQAIEQSTGQDNHPAITYEHESLLGVCACDVVLIWQSFIWGRKKGDGCRVSYTVHGVWGTQIHSALVAVICTCNNINQSESKRSPLPQPQPQPKMHWKRLRKYAKHVHNHFPAHHTWGTWNDGLSK